jgi:hypothetical protein
MVHLRALPGAPGGPHDVEAVLARARSDARALAAGGVDGVVVENFGDVPFLAGGVPPWTVAAMTRAVSAVRDVVGDRPVGVNVLRNDARAALGVAAATGAAFVRINVHTGTMWSDQGPLTGAAADTLRTRDQICPSVAIVADVHVKHATPPPGERLEDAARDTWHRGLADALLVSGRGTGWRTDPAAVRRVRAALPEAPVWVGSGVDPSSVATLLDAGATGFIVGSALQEGGIPGAPVVPERVAALVAAVTRRAPSH